VKKQTRYRLEAAAVAVVATVARILPRRVLFGFGEILGGMWAALDGRHRRIAADNLRQAFPDWDEARILSVARGVYLHFAKTVLDVLWMDRLSVDEMMDFADVEGRQYFEAAVASGRGVILPTGHIGNWEFQGVAVKEQWRSIGVIARPLDNPLLDARLDAFRSKGGNAVISKRRALSDTLRIIRGGGGVAVLVDQNVQAKDGIFVDFFGRAACTTTVAAAIAVKTGCILLPGYCPRMPDGRYKLIYGPPIEWQPSGSREKDIRELTQRITSVIEGWVREWPEQWLWIHRRWKTQPSTPAVPSPGERAS